MKKLPTLLVLFLYSGLIYAQSPEKISYQAVVRDADNKVVVNKAIGMQISILAGTLNGNPVYVESHTLNANSNGMVSVEIGTGATSDNFSTIDWGQGPYFIKTEADPTGGTNYSIVGGSQILSVPYALHAKTAEGISGGITENDPVYATSPAANIKVDDINKLNNLSGVNTGDQDLSTLATKEALGDSLAQIRNEIPGITQETDPVFEASVASSIEPGDTTRWNQKLDVEVDGSVTNEIQTLSIQNDTIILSNGGQVKVPFGPEIASDGELVTYDGTNWVAKKALIANTGGGQAQNNMQPWLGVSYIIALQGIFPSRSSAEPFIAEIIMFGGNFAPRGWAYCNGQLLPISSNSALFSLIGTTYGGDGRVTFALPDLRGRVAVHPGSVGGLTTRVRGEKGGTETNTMTIDQLPAHSHTIYY